MPAPCIEITNMTMRGRPLLAITTTTKQKGKKNYYRCEAIWDDDDESNSFNSS